MLNHNSIQDKRLRLFTSREVSAARRLVDRFFDEADIDGLDAFAINPEWVCDAFRRRSNYFLSILMSDEKRRYLYQCVFADKLQEEADNHEGYPFISEELPMMRIIADKTGLSVPHAEAEGLVSDLMRDCEEDDAQAFWLYVQTFLYECSKICENFCAITRQRFWDCLNELELSPVRSKSEAVSGLNFGGVYFVSDGRAIKIGRSNNIGKRVPMLQVGNPYKMKIIGAIETKDDLRVEKMFHNLYSLHRLTGEWFLVPEEEVLKDILRHGGVVYA